MCFEVCHFKVSNHCKHILVEHKRAQQNSVGAFAVGKSLGFSAYIHISMKNKVGSWTQGKLTIWKQVYSVPLVKAYNKLSCWISRHQVSAQFEWSQSQNISFLPLLGAIIEHWSVPDCIGEAKVPPYHVYSILVTFPEILGEGLQESEQKKQEIQNSPNRISPTEISSQLTSKDGCMCGIIWKFPSTTNQPRLSDWPHFTLRFLAH